MQHRGSFLWRSEYVTVSIIRWSVHADRKGHGFCGSPPVTRAMCITDGWYSSHGALGPGWAVLGKSSAVPVLRHCITFSALFPQDYGTVTGLQR